MPKVLSNSEMASLLPEFFVKKSKDFTGWLVVTCPREDCGDLFLARTVSLYRKRTYKHKSGETTIVGRSCPYCFRASRLPDRRRIR